MVMEQVMVMDQTTNKDYGRNQPIESVNKGQGYKSKSTTSNSLFETNFTTLDEAEYIRYYRQNHKNSKAKIQSNISIEMNQDIGELKL